MKSPNIPGWHTEEAEADERGTTVQTLRKQRRLGIGPQPVKYGRRPLYQDGGFASWLEEQRIAQQAAAERKQNGTGSRLRNPRDGEKALTPTALSMRKRVRLHSTLPIRPDR